MEKRKPPVRRMTARDVAAALGLSAMTVSRALNNRGNVDTRTRKKVLQAARRLGYVPNQIAKSLVLRRTHTIGVVVPEITHSFFPEAIRGIEEIAYEAGYHLILTHSAESASRERDAIRTLESHRVDGILISSAQTVEDYRQYRHLIKAGVPLVFFDRCVHGIGASCVGIDDEECALQMTLHLIGHGCRPVAHLRGPRMISVARERFDGFCKAMAQCGLTVDPELVVESGFHESGGYQAMKQLLALPDGKRPRGVVAVNDPAAFGAIAAIREAGLNVPADVAIVGFSDDIRAPLMPASLTTVRQPAYEVGRRAAQRLLDIIQGRNGIAEDVVVRSVQIIRRSCGCCPAVEIDHAQ